MNYRYWLAAFSTLLLFTAVGMAADPVLVLSLKAKVDGRVTSAVEFFTCERDPNVKRADCPQHISIDGKKVNVPERTLQRLDNLRRAFSYDAQSGGIRQAAARSAVCRLGGPSEGAVLEVRYLTYVDSRIVSDEMKPVFALASNCLFQESYSPSNTNAHDDARAVAEILETVREFAGTNR